MSTTTISEIKHSPNDSNDDLSFPPGSAIEQHVSLRLVGTRSGIPMRLTYFAADALAIGAAYLFTIIAGNLLRGRGWLVIDATQFKLYAMLSFGLIVVGFLGRTYSPIPPRPVRQFRGWVLGSFAVCAITVTVELIFDLAGSVEAELMVVGTLLAVVAASFNRAMCRIRFGHSRWWGTRILVVGNGGLAATAFADLCREPQWGLRPVGFVGDAPPLDAMGDAAQYLGTVDQLDAVAKRCNVDRALISVHTFESEEVADLLARAYGTIRHWIVLPSLERFPSMWLKECETARLPALSVTNRLALPTSFALKRTFDLLIVGAVAVLASPLFALVALLVKVTSPGPIFYGQERLGQHGRRFKAWKFRTMVPNADAVLAEHLANHPELAAEWAATHKLKKDPRVTCVGRWLRPLSLDELPQIWNVLVGEMSLVGPRPIVAAEISKYADRYQRYTQVVPGVTGLWQVSGRNNTTYEERVDLDAYYVQNWSIWLDLYILACTVKVVVLGEGAY